MPAGACRRTSTLAHWPLHERCSNSALSVGQLRTPCEKTTSFWTGGGGDSIIETAQAVVMIADADVPFESIPLQPRNVRVANWNARTKTRKQIMRCLFPLASPFPCTYGFAVVVITMAAPITALPRRTAGRTLAGTPADLSCPVEVISAATWALFLRQLARGSAS